MDVIYVSGGSATVPAGGTVPLGTIVRKLGCSYDLKGDGVTCAPGFAEVDAVVTLAPVETDSPSRNEVTLMQDGKPVQGGARAIQSVSTVTIPISATVRVGCCSKSTLTLVNTGAAANVESVSMRVTEG